MLFDVVYPWAGQDRTTTASHLVVSKGSDKKKVMFANPEDIRRSVEYALKLGQDEAFMAAKPGEVMGYLAFGHPFLDGNGRAIMVLHCVLAQRAGISIDWASTNKSDYLTALTNELDDPGKGHLDAYLKPFVRKGISQSGLAANVAGAPGLDGEGEDVVLGNIDDPELKAEYRAKRLKRKEGLK